MASVRDIFEMLCTVAPLELKMDFDNPGFLVGSAADEVSRIMVALDITDEVIDEAAGCGAQLIVSHHPVIFTPLKRVRDDEPDGEKVMRLIRSGISAVCMHTNLDAAPGGVNDALLEALGARIEGVLNTEEGISRTGVLPEPMAFDDFLSHIKKALDCNGLRYHDSGRSVSRIGVCGGAGAGDLELAASAGCDAYVTADVKYHEFLLAKQLGISLVDADHFCTENVVVPVLAKKLQEAFPELDVRISQMLGQTVQFY